MIFVARSVVLCQLIFMNLDIVIFLDEWSFASYHYHICNALELIIDASCL